MAVTSWSIKLEDIVLLRALQGVDRNDGFYIDVGANAPDEHSATKLFYDHGWRGLNIEASPFWYERLVAERPRDINLNVAAADSAGTITLYDHPEGGLATTNQQITDQNQQLSSIAKSAIEAETTTLTDLCERYAPPTIHFLKIDIEGHEEQAIRGMDFSRFRPWIVCVKATEPRRADILTHEAWDHLITGAGYRYVQFDGLNRWYVANEHPERFSAFDYPADDYVHNDYLCKIADLERRLRDIESRVAGAEDVVDLPVRIARLYETKPENAYYEALYGGSRSLRGRPSELGFSSTLCQQLHFSLDDYRFWMGAMDRRPRMHRKDWEWFYIAQVLFERGCLEPGQRGLGFAVGREPLPAAFAARGCTILSTDQSAELAMASGWVETHQHSVNVEQLFNPNICPSGPFYERVAYRSVDMNAIPSDFDGGFDFCWSSCSLEHLGSLEHGLRFVEQAMATLRPGGVAVHTTEFNLSSNTDTLESESLSIYRRSDIEALVARLEAAGHSVEPFDWNIGQGFAESVVDLPPYRQSPHLRLRFADYDVTSIGIIVRRGR